MNISEYQFVVQYTDDENANFAVESDSTVNCLPFANSPLFHVEILGGRIIASGKDIKNVYELILSRKDVDYDFQLGDTIGICPQNNTVEVNTLLRKLNVSDVADKIYKIDVSNANSKKPLIPSHIPLKGTLRHLFTNHLHVQGAPKKTFLKALIPHCSSASDREQLAYLCHPSNSADYLQFLRTNRSLSNILNTFNSCEPSIECLIKHLTKLQPRPYSLSSSPLCADELRIVFSVEAADHAKGVCTRWLESLIKAHRTHNNETAKNKSLIPIYFRKPNNFRLIPSPRTPIMMIASGVGIAPFYGFLRHVKLTGEKSPFYLFYGCRYTRDFLFRGDLMDLKADGYLSELHSCFSREGNQEYVQEIVRREAGEIVEKILKENGIIYVCGNVNMIKQVQCAIIDLLIGLNGSSESEAECLIADLIKNCRYLTDAWT